MRQAISILNFYTIFLYKITDPNEVLSRDQAVQPFEELLGRHGRCNRQHADALRAGKRQMPAL